MKSGLVAEHSRTESANRKVGKKNGLGYRIGRWLVGAAFASAVAGGAAAATPPSLLAGAAKLDVTDYSVQPVGVPGFARALALQLGGNRLVIVAVDAIAIGSLGRIDDGFMRRLRKRFSSELDIPPEALIVAATHAHTTIAVDIEDKVVDVAREAIARMESATLAVSSFSETRLQENRRYKLLDGVEADARHSYALPADESVNQLGKVDPNVAVLRVSGSDGRSIAIVYNFAAHPIADAILGRNSANYPGVASQVLEAAMGQDSVALFLQGAAGDINPLGYKDLFSPPSEEIIGERLAAGVLVASNRARTIENPRIRSVVQRLSLPAAVDHDARIAEIDVRRASIVESLVGTSINLKGFMQLSTLHALNREYPIEHRIRYMGEVAKGRHWQKERDKFFGDQLALYEANILKMEELSRLSENRARLVQRRDQLASQQQNFVEADVSLVDVGGAVLVVFPGEMSSATALRVRRLIGAPVTFVAGYANGYIYYTPTAEQRANKGYAQEDCDSLVAPEWEDVYLNWIRSRLKELDLPDRSDT